MSAPEGFCYVIHAPDVGRVKIGFAKDPQSRLSDLQTAAPCELLIVRVFDGGHPRERELHERFADHRSHREWFSDEILPELMGIPVEYEEPPPPRLYGRRPKKGLKPVHPNSTAANKWGRETFYFNGPR